MRQWPKLGCSSHCGVCGIFIHFRPISTMDITSKLPVLVSASLWFLLLSLTSSWQVDGKIGTNTTVKPFKPQEENLKINLAVLLPKDPWFDFSAVKVVPGIMMALQSDRVRDLIGSTCDLAFREYDSKCSQEEVLRLSVDALRSRQDAVDVYLGPSCSYASANIARLVSHWRKVYVTSGCVANSLDGNNVTRMSVTASKLGKMIFDVVTNVFKWNTTAVIAADTERSERLTYCYFLSLGYLSVMATHGFYPESNTIAQGDTQEEIKEMLTESVMPHARILRLVNFTRELDYEAAYLHHSQPPPLFCPLSLVICLFDIMERMIFYTIVVINY